MNRRMKAILSAFSDEVATNERLHHIPSVSATRTKAVAGAGASGQAAPRKLPIFVLNAALYE